MPPRRIQFTQADIDAQLQQIHLLDASSNNENLESLVPLLKTVHDNHQVEAFLRTTQGLVDSKEKEIETICGNNYQDFVSSVSTLLTVRSYTENLRERIQTLDTSVSAVGNSFAAKKKAVLQSKKTAANLDEAIDTLQACLRVLDLVNRVGDMIKEGRYWSALKTPFFTYLLSSLPSLRGQIKDAVTASTKSWLFEIRNISGQVGQLALDAMKTRARRWKAKREKEPLLRLSLVGSAVEMVTNEKVEFNVLDNDQIHVDFKPLYQCIHIYTALDAIQELQRTYQADRKAQALLILSDRMSTASANKNLATTLLPLTEDIVGFFIVESEVLRTTQSFRSHREVDELWDSVVAKLMEVLHNGLREDGDVETFLSCKEIILSFIQTLEGYSYDTNRLRALIFILFENYSGLLDRTFSAQFKKAVNDDDNLPMEVKTKEDLDRALMSCWLQGQKAEELQKIPLPGVLPFSQVFYSCCAFMRQFVDKFYQFVEGVSHQHRDIDELLRKALDQLLTKHVSENIAHHLSSTRNVSQVAQVLTNIEYFQETCTILEEQLMKLRATQRGGSIRLMSYASFASLHSQAVAHLISVLNNKLTDIFETAEYDWTPNQPETTPSMYLWDTPNWLMTVVDGMSVPEEVKEEVYRGALNHIAESLMNFLVGPDVKIVNDDGLSNLATDIEFLEDQFQRPGKPDLTGVFKEIRTTVAIVTKEDVASYLIPAKRQQLYSNVQPRKLGSLLEKMARFTPKNRSVAELQKVERRRQEAQAMSRMIVAHRIETGQR
ncbi:hypothetical protein FRB96_000025 [Tulasnella sp. 330]|nr:hypothetical protein FRB96_000025 [Tulasnella sp. 330]KAG8890493.1 hypothetical protein FRB98_007840 [Tulasnella sp. 332]